MLGVGFGPSNLALAVALAERGVRGRFVDAQPRFGWHRDMLLPGTRMQIPFLKDLVTLRNPQSAYTFVNYLNDRGRLIDFIGRHDVFPSRHEFHDYLQWAADQFAADVQYGRRVVRVTATDNGFEVHLDPGEVVAARTLVLGTGLHPVLPAGTEPTRRQWHSHQLLSALAALGSPEVGRFAVVGAGQSAAEVVGYLHHAYPLAEVHAVFGRYGYSLADDSAFVNRIFDPSAVDEFYGADSAERQRLLDYHRSANYSAVDVDLIADLYEREYGERVGGDRRLFLHRACAVVGADEDDVEVRLGVRNLIDNTTETVRCDAVVYATGYAPMDVAAFLGELASCYEFDAQGRPVATRDYRLVARPGAPGDIYLNGATVEHSHGLGATLLSNVAVRSGEIAAAISP
ncbi:putative peptide monooxygenase [Mycolicibacterium aubagnense]|uniref:L-lysine N6-monooxygenase MbtG n=1 Tax=Mycolicibacterium aubagnense TaxID=319707 RepID=A0ABN5YWG0_9MYCO|nr:SidA/IucD/PvdA family monooxygenase [Mycolicibacterium aubagnense]TLH68500.1 L-lysine 6-monooxygenase [Mycolicibacterium aubagnense]WGI35664.1 SidA/IucD/PvdA family monooxygenase [Mycolicibacterium aubagnense]BBX86237.1 putative peptide monooxygenase [Mycolicibacterium aubagnense]